MRITGFKIVRAIFSSFLGKWVEDFNSQSSEWRYLQSFEWGCGAVICKALSGAVGQAIT